MKLQIQRLDPEAKVPSFSYSGDAGMDIFSIEAAEIPPGEKRAIKTGLKLAIPEGHAGFIWDKSGMAVKHHIKTMAGVIDSNYRGELLVVLTNLGKEPYMVEKGSKVAQMIISQIAAPEIEETELVDITERGEKGFGSSDFKRIDYASTMMSITQQVIGKTAISPSVPPQSKEYIPRPNWDQYFMMLTKLVAIMATCPKRRVGAVIVRNKRILATGFNGAPPGLPHCTEVDCLIFPDEGSSCRRVIHSEENAVLQDSKNLEGATLYTSFIPCVDCMKAIVTAKISEIVYEEEYTKSNKGRYAYSKEFALGTNVKLRKIPQVDIIQALARYYGNSETS